MAATELIKNKFLSYKTKAGFETDLNNGFVNANSIAFISGESAIWTKGKYYYCSPSDFATMTKAITDRLDVLEGEADVEGSVKYAVKALEDSINAILGEIEAGKTVAELIGDITKEGGLIDTKVKALQGDTEKTVKEIEDALGQETERAMAAEKANSDALAAKVMADGYTTEVEIGGMAKGTDIAGKTAEEVLDLILKPEYAPVITDATATIACTDHTNNEVVEVGTKTPLETAYTSGGNKAKTAAGSSTSNVVYGGEASDSFAINSATAGTSLSYDTTTTKRGVFKVRVTKSYAAGTDPVITNKGNSTNKVASNYTTIMANASASTKIDASTYVIKSQSKTADFTINYTYKVYASTATAGVLTSMGLLTSLSNKEATLKGGSAGQMFAIPSTYSKVKIEEYNATLNSWTDTTSGWTVGSTTYTLADGTEKVYTTYTRANSSGEDMKARISATLGD
jgi:hypothetical protein